MIESLLSGGKEYWVEINLCPYDYNSNNKISQGENNEQGVFIFMYEFNEDDNDFEDGINKYIRGEDYWLEMSYHRYSDNDCHREKDYDYDQIPFLCEWDSDYDIFLKVLCEEMGEIFSGDNDEILDK